MFDVLRRSMIARLVALGAVAIVTSGVEEGCVFGAKSGDGDPLENVDDGSGNGDTFETTLTLRDSAGTETYTFDSDDLITFQLSVRNRTATERTVNLATTQVSDFFVFEDGEEISIWNSAHNQSFATVVTPLNFAANETKTISFTWNQVLPNGAALAPGDYDARGLIAAIGVSTDPEDPHELRSVLRAFRVN